MKDDDDFVIYGSSENVVGYNSTQSFKHYKWSPKEDITAYELALCLPAIMHGNFFTLGFYVEELPENARRHFVELVS